MLQNIQIRDGEYTKTIYSMVSIVSCFKMYSLCVFVCIVMAFEPLDTNAEKRVKG